MNNELMLAKILYKNFSGNSNSYSHNDFTVSESIKIEESQIVKLGLTIPIYCNPADRCIYSGINIDSSSLDLSKPIAKEIICQSDYLLIQPITHVIKAINKKTANRTVIVSSTPDIHQCFTNALQSKNIFFFNSPGFLTQLANLKFSRDSIKTQLIEAYFQKLETLIPNNQDYSLTILSGSQVFSSAEILKQQKVNLIFSLVEIDCWINQNNFKENLTDDEINKLIKTYNAILKNIDQLSNHINCQVIWANNSFDVNINDSFSLEIKESYNRDGLKKVFDKSISDKIKKIWREKTPTALLRKFDRKL